MKRMLNALSRKEMSHYCFDPETGRPCCNDVSEVVKHMQVVASAVLAMINAGSAKPSFGRWFTAAWRLRGILAGHLVHNLLPRSWQHQFRKDIQAALDGRPVDDAHVGERTFQQEQRLRHRKVTTMLQTPDLAQNLLSLLVAVAPVERLNFHIYTKDAARKQLQKRRQGVNISESARVPSELLHAAPGVPLAPVPNLSHAAAFDSRSEPPTTQSSFEPTRPDGAFWGLDELERIEFDMSAPLLFQADSERSSSTADAPALSPSNPNHAGCAGFFVWSRCSGRSCL